GSSRLSARSGGGLSPGGRPAPPGSVVSSSVDGTTTLSPQAHQRLTDELAERSGPTRRNISELIERARELGDLKEHGDYHAAKNEQGLNEARVRQLEAMLTHAVVVEASTADTAATGTVVEVLMRAAAGPATPPVAASA